MIHCNALLFGLAFAWLVMAGADTSEETREAKRAAMISRAKYEAQRSLERVQERAAWRAQWLAERATQRAKRSHKVWLWLYALLLLTGAGLIAAATIAGQS
jgi:hypothetical protein